MTDGHREPNLVDYLLQQASNTDGSSRQCLLEMVAIVLRSRFSLFYLPLQSFLLKKSRRWLTLRTFSHSMNHKLLGWPENENDVSVPAEADGALQALSSKLDSAKRSLVDAVAFLFSSVQF
jgi:hypothetical protein